MKEECYNLLHTQLGHIIQAVLAFLPEQLQAA